MPITEFRGPYRFLSNFYLHSITVEGVVFGSVEHAYQTFKTVIPSEREYVRSAGTCAEAKKRGGRITLRADWLAVRVEIMRNCLEAKFADPYLRRLLLETGTRELVEVNWWGDRFWGVCSGVGENQLGKLLMAIRTIAKGA